MQNYVQTSSGIILPEYIIRKPKLPIAFDFFAGCGGFSCGAIQAGFEIIGANEFNPEASITYMCNLGNYPIDIHYIEGEKDKNRLDHSIEQDYKRKPKSAILYETYTSGSGWISKTDFPGVKNFWFGDVCKLTGKEILDTLGLKQGDIDVVCGGPPCQGFSKCGKREVGDKRNNLVYEFARMIVELQPKTFIMEEVPDVLNFYDSDGVPVLDKFCMILQNGDFGKWDMIKKSLLTQAGSAGVLKDQLQRHKNIKPKKEKRKSDEPNLFDEYKEVENDNNNQ
ncbi:MAG: DNA cytosine methyltransferase [Tannerella sp.]|jgi:DNA (cytosine-5)-methyltransferase 1|nr:DNA cytosine methyltransferase [Tannerella sp.]